ERRAGSDPLSN
ncbi:unnamed protein product, partial [Oikopleura dioica]